MRANRKPVKVVYSKMYKGENLTDSYIEQIGHDPEDEKIESRDKKVIRRKLLSDPDIYMVNFYDIKVS